MKTPAYKILEEKYAQFAGTKYAVACNSGTSGLHLSLVSLGIGKGDEVICPDFTMAACGFAISYCGAKVVTVDCGDDYNIDPKLIEAKITKRTKAIMAVHIYGRLCDMAAIKKIARKHKLKVIEDGCEAQGAAKGGNSDALVFSFYKNKIIHAEEGGIVCTNDKKLYERMQYLKNMAFGDKHDYYHAEIGFNYRMPEAMAKMTLQSLKKYPKNQWKRHLLANLIYRGRGAHDAVWVLDFMTNSEEERDMNLGQLRGKGRPFFKPLSTMPMWRQKVGPKALDFSKRGFYRCITDDML